MLCYSFLLRQRRPFCINLRFLDFFSFVTKVVSYILRKCKARTSCFKQEYSLRSNSSLTTLKNQFRQTKDWYFTVFDFFFLGQRSCLEEIALNVKAAICLTFLYLSFKDIVLIFGEK